MSEKSHNSEEPLEGREYEIEQFVYINEFAQEMIDAGCNYGGVHVGDAIFDYIYFLGRAMTRRDPEFGCLLVQKLRERAGNDDVSTSEADTHQYLAGQIEMELPVLRGQQSPSSEPPTAPEI